MAIRCDSLAVAPDGTIASGDWSGEIRLWDGRDGRFSARAGQAGDRRLARLSFSPDGKLLLSAAAARSQATTHATVYDIASGKEIVDLHRPRQYRDRHGLQPGRALGGDRRRRQQEIHLWDPHSGKPRPGPDGKPLRLAGQGQPVWAAGFSADGRRIGWGNSLRYHDGRSIDYGLLEQALTLPLGEGALGAPVALAEAEAGAFRRAQASFGGFSLSHQKGRRLWL